MSKKIGLFKKCPGYQHNFETLKRAFANGDVCLMECKDKATGKEVAVVCGVQRSGDGMIDMVPMAKLFDGNPYEQLLSPMEVDEMEKV